MAFPFTFHENFESGSKGGFDSESGTGDLLDFPHYSTLIKDANSLMPYKGAYCMRNVLGDTNDHTVTEGSIDIADTEEAYFRWYMGLSKDFRFTADNTFNVFELQQAGGTVEVSVGFKVTNSTQLIEFGIGDGTAPTSFVQWPGRGKWVCVELYANIETDGSGVVTLYIDGTETNTLTTQTHAAGVGQGVLGSQLTLATTLGAIYYDDFIMDDTRIYPDRERFPIAVNVDKTGHLFIGPGHIEGVALRTLATGDETLKLYDTDVANTNSDFPYVELDSTAQTSVGGPIFFQRGCYAVLGGTSPRGAVHLLRSSNKPGVHGPFYYSDWGMKYYGRIRKQRANNV